MILSDKTIKEYIDSNSLVIDPIEEYQIQPASVDCILDENFLQVKKQEGKILNLTTPIEYEEINQKTMVMQPNSFILATTREYIKLPDFIASFVEGRSSIGRMGLFIQNAGWIGPRLLWSNNSRVIQC